MGEERGRKERGEGTRGRGERGEGRGERGEGRGERGDGRGEQGCEWLPVFLRILQMQGQLLFLETPIQTLRGSHLIVENGMRIVQLQNQKELDEKKLEKLDG